MRIDFDELRVEDVDQVMVETSGLGPFVEDISFVILARNLAWKIHESDQEAFLEWLKILPNVEYEALLQSSLCVEDNLFQLYDCRIKIGEQRKRCINRLRRFLSRSLKIDSSQVETIVEEVITAYEGPNRYYHTLDHIEHCLNELDPLQDPQLNKTAVELAIWFHDLIYRPAGSENELKSAQRMQQLLKNTDNHELIEAAACLITASKNTDPKTTLKYEVSRKYFKDIDFSILGSSWLEYRWYYQQVRLEYEEIAAVAFYMKRKGLLKQILSGSIYETKTFIHRYETQARKNIQKELQHKPYPYIPSIKTDRYSNNYSAK